MGLCLEGQDLELGFGIWFCFGSVARWFDNESFSVQLSDFVKLLVSL